MVEYRNNCVGCPPEMGCLGNDCSRVNVKYCICDKCNNEVETLYVFDGAELCEECVLDSLERIEVDK